MYVWQMNDGQWQVSAYTSTQWNSSMVVFRNGFETREAAETALADWKAAGNVVVRRW